MVTAVRIGAIFTIAIFKFYFRKTRRKLHTLGKG